MNPDGDPREGHRMVKSGYVKVFGVALTAGAFAATFVAASHADDPTIRISTGPVRGNVAADHRSCQGIPYATPRVDAQHRRAPRQRHGALLEHGLHRHRRPRDRASLRVLDVMSMT
jgi:hypothetical protein